MYLKSTFYLKDQEIEHIFHLYFCHFLGCQQGSYVTHSPRCLERLKLSLVDCDKTDQNKIFLLTLVEVELLVEMAELVLVGIVRLLDIH